MRNRLIIIVGGTGTGKTFIVNQLIKEFSPTLTRVKTFTTREPRNEQDHESYNFLTPQEFARRVKSGDIFEYDLIRSERGQYYVGSSLDEIKQVLKNSSGIVSLTPSGVAALRKHRVLISVFLLQPARQAYKKNLSDRGLRPLEQWKMMCINHFRFRIPQDIPHMVMPVTRTHKDQTRFVYEVGKLICQPQ
ncbi:hypothetical protein KW791_01200 [Candidatus Parcubacteria bacterium]|nr:hypothetical protein [Candidatus Parcubacteria bacterium]